MLNPELDVKKLSDEFRQKKRILIRNLFKPDAADTLHQCLLNETPWVLRFHFQGNSSEFTREQFEQLTPQQRMQFANDSARFDFIHKRFAMDQAFQENKHHELFLHELYNYMAQEQFLDFVRQVTGNDEIKKRGAMATCFDPGNFLREHDDYQDGELRLCAYVLNMSRNWRPDWGGMLHFLNYDRDVIDTFVPWFNSMSLFAVPVPHMVSMVSPFAEGSRYSVTGWFYPS
jgi:Rps23 Pro-64 3,4-dihydroxylase Tpa1-like proline 4-hydroxylase